MKKFLNPSLTDSIYNDHLKTVYSITYTDTDIPEIPDTLHTAHLLRIIMFFSAEDADQFGNV